MSTARPVDDSTRIIRGVTDVSQLNDRQYRNGNFYVGGSSNAYTTVQSSLVRREIMALQGGQDTTIPAVGGSALGGSLTMNSDADSIYACACRGRRTLGVLGCRIRVCPIRICSTCCVCAHAIPHWQTHWPTAKRVRSRVRP